MKHFDRLIWRERLYPFNKTNAPELYRECRSNSSSKVVAAIYQHTATTYSAFIYDAEGKVLFSIKETDDFPWKVINRELEARAKMEKALSEMDKTLSEIGKAESDPVKAPSHYRQHPSGVECIEIIQWFPLNIGSAVKYLWRAGLKEGNPTIQDLRKAIQYIEFEIKRLEGTAPK